MIIGFEGPEGLWKTATETSFRGHPGAAKTPPETAFQRAENTARLAIPKPLS